MCFYGSMHHRNLPYISGPVDEGKCPTAGAAGNIFSLHNECTLQDDCSDLTSSRRSSAAASKWLPLGAKIEPGKLVRGLAGVRSTKLQETVFTTFCRRPAGPRLNHLCLSHNDLSQLSPQLFVEVCKLDISHNEASALEDL